MEARENEDMKKIEAYTIVYNELVRVGLFSGTYDAVHGSRSYMNGVATVMEQIAMRAGVEKEYEELFMKNLVRSEQKIEGNPVRTEGL